MDTKTLDMMREDLYNFTRQEMDKYKDAGCDQVNIVVRDTLITEEARKEYNTCVEARKMFNQQFKVFVNLDDTYSFQDIANLGLKTARYIVTDIKKDMFQFGTIQKAFKTNHPKMKDENILKRAIKEFKDMKNE